MRNTYRVVMDCLYYDFEVVCSICLVFIEYVNDVWLIGIKKNKKIKYIYIYNL